TQQAPLTFAADRADETSCTVQARNYFFFIVRVVSGVRENFSGKQYRNFREASSVQGDVQILFWSYSAETNNEIAFVAPYRAEFQRHSIDYRRKKCRTRRTIFML